MEARSHRPRDGGKGGKAAEALVILPGLLCDSRMFQHQASTLGGVVIDGFYEAADRIETMATYALERMPAHCALMGHSMGARVAIEIWRRAPERVARLALVDTGVHPVTDGEREKRYALHDLGRRAGAEALVDAWLPPMVGPAGRGDRRLMAMLRAMAVDAGVTVYKAQIEALLHRPDAAAVLKTIDCPVLVAVGRQDQWSPVAQHRLIADALPDARLAILEDAGHMAPAERPEDVTALLRDWLDWPTDRRPATSTSSRP